VTDIIEELDRWLADLEPWGPLQMPKEFIQRARDEIVALRERLIEPARHSYQPTRQYIQIQPLELIAAKARAEALEEAARLCDATAAEWGYTEATPVARELAAAIRALCAKKENL